MLAELASQLNTLGQTLYLKSDCAGRVEPGQRVDLELVSRAPSLFAMDKVLEIPSTGTLTTPATGTPVTSQIALASQVLAAVPVELSVQWRVKRGDQLLLPGQDYLTTGGHNGPAASFLFKPEFLELGSAKALHANMVQVEALVTLRIRPNNQPPIAPLVQTVPLPVRLDLPLAPLEIPTMLCLFRFDDYRSLGTNDLTPGFVLIVVPKDSPLKDLTAMTNATFERIDQALRPLRSLTGLAAFLSGLEVLRHALAAQPMVRLRHGDIGDLDAIHMRLETLFGVDLFDRDLRPNDRVSSLIFMGVPRRSVACFNDEDFAEGEGAFTVSTDVRMINLIRTLRLNAAQLDALPGVQVTNASDDNYDDSMTSVRFPN